MPAFQAYAGAYDHAGRAYSWRCYATARVYQIRRAEHAPFPPAPKGRKWISPARRNSAEAVGCLVDEGVEDFSQILLQVFPLPDPMTRNAAA